MTYKDVLQKIVDELGEDEVTCALTEEMAGESGDHLMDFIYEEIVDGGDVCDEAAREDIQAAEKRLLTGVLELVQTVQVLHATAAEMEEAEGAPV